MLIVLDYHVIVTLYLLPAYILSTVSIVPLLHLLTTVSTLLISFTEINQTYLKLMMLIST